MTNHTKTLIIAEAGVNHNGSIKLAKQLIDVAASAGVDYVKFQTFKTEKLVSKTAKKADYQIENTENDKESQFEMLKKLELNKDIHIELMDYARQKKISFLSTAFDLESIDLLEELGLDRYKIPSGELTNKPYLEKIASKSKPIILSTGMARLGEIEDALNVLLKNGVKKDQITVLHCNTQYPTPMREVNLKAMLSIKEAFKVKVGYSDHTLGIEVPIAAVAMGAVCIEKHFTLDRKMEGPDHNASLEPHELTAMVKGIRNIEIALGDGIKKPTPSEQKNIPVARKSIHLSRDLHKGHIIQEEDLIMMRPGLGISPMNMDLVLGRQLKRDKPAHSRIELEDLS